MEFVFYCYEFFVFAISLLASYTLYRLTKLWLLSWVVLAALVVCIIVPDEVAERNWRKVCSTDGGIQVYEQSTATGFYIDGTTVNYIRGMLERGYLRIETKDTINNKSTVVSYEMLGGKLSKYKTSQITSDYKVLTINSTYKGYVTFETVIENSAGARLSTDRSLYFYGGPFFRGVRSIMESSKSNKESWQLICPKSSDPTNLIIKTIPPKTS